MFCSEECCECDSPKDCKEKKCTNNKTLCGKKAKAALKRAHDIRKFEITMLWERARYVATFQTLLFAALGVSFSAEVLTPNGSSGNPKSTVYILRLIICVVGVYSSFFWCLINKGSKFWHENWERHIDFLEDKFEGKLHKTVLHEGGRRPYSVSRVNISISQMFFVAWFVLLAIIASDALQIIKCYCNMFYVHDNFCVLALMVVIAISLLVFRQKLKTKFKNRCKNEIYRIRRRLPKDTKSSPLSSKWSICDEFARCWNKVIRCRNRSVLRCVIKIRNSIRKLCSAD